MGHCMVSVKKQNIHLETTRLMTGIKQSLFPKKLDEQELLLQATKL